MIFLTELSAVSSMAWSIQKAECNDIVNIS
nr:MAG TPA: hypothetical protein [Caudoviricetes sp.]